VSTFDPDYLDYFNFLECIVRVTKARPWTEEEETNLPHFDNKLDRVCNLLEEKFHEELTPMFEQQRDAFEHERHYQPRVVVEDDEAGDSEDDDMHWQRALKYTTLFGWTLFQLIWGNSVRSIHQISWQIEAFSLTWLTKECSWEMSLVIQSFIQLSDAMFKLQGLFTTVSLNFNV